MNIIVTPCNYNKKTGEMFREKEEGKKVSIGYENISFGIVGATPSFAEAMDGMLELPEDEEGGSRASRTFT